MGKTFVLNFGIKHRINIFSFFSKNSRYLKILINTEKVLGIKGKLDDFYIVAHNYILHCTHTDVELSPL